MDFRILLEKITPVLRAVARRHILTGYYGEDDLYQEMCLYLWQRYGNGLPIGINESYVIKGCEFHIQNFIRKGRPRVIISRIDEPVGTEGATLGDLLEDKSSVSADGLCDRITIEEIRAMDLTDKERAVLSLLLKGSTVREAAKEMGISHVMVLKHKKSILRKWRNRRLPKR